MSGNVENFDLPVMLVRAGPRAVGQKSKRRCGSLEMFLDDQLAIDRFSIFLVDTSLRVQDFPEICFFGFYESICCIDFRDVLFLVDRDHWNLGFIIFRIQHELFHRYICRCPIKSVFEMFYFM